MKRLLLAVALIVGVGIGQAQAALIVSGSVGGAPAGVTLDNLDWLTLGAGGGLSPVSGITVNVTADALAVHGSAVNLYAAPYVSGLNGTGFGNAPNAPDASTYLSSGIGAVEILLPASQKYFGLLWGSVDGYNTLSFYDGATLVGSLTGFDVLAGASGDQGVNGTLYVNINSTDAFNRVVARSSQYAFEFDNLAFNPTAVPEPASLLLLGLGFAAVGTRLRNRL